MLCKKLNDFLIKNVCEIEREKTVIKNFNNKPNEVVDKSMRLTLEID